jgi:2'-5' RNA ligase
MSKPYDIVLLPELAIAEHAMQVSRQLSGEGTFYELDNQQFFPHVSVYMIQLKRDQVAQTAQALAALAADTGVFALTAEQYGGSKGYINLSYEKTDALAELQERIVTRVNPLRDGLTPEEAALVETATGATKDNIEQYGYKSVGELFVPHLTLTRFVDPTTAPDSDKLPAAHTFSGQFPSIGLFEVGEHGTCIREIARFALQEEQKI